MPDDGPTVLGDPIVLATWSSVFPLSKGPAHRIGLLIGPTVGEDLSAQLRADYLQEISARVAPPFAVSSDGDLLGSGDFDGEPSDILFAAVFAADLDAVVRRKLSTVPTPTVS